MEKPEATFSEAGNAALKASDFAAAVDAYSKAIDLAPKDASLYLGRAVAHYKLSKFSFCLLDADAAIEIDYSLAKAYFWKACALLSLHHTEAAYAAAAVAAHFEPNLSSEDGWAPFEKHSASFFLEKPVARWQALVDEKRTLILTPGAYPVILGSIFPAGRVVGIGSGVILKQDSSIQLSFQGTATLFLAYGQLYMENLTIMGTDVHTIDSRTPEVKCVLRKCEITAGGINLGYPLVNITSCTGQFMQCRFHASGGGALLCSAGAKLILDECVLENNPMCGFEVRELGTAAVSRCTIRNNGQGVLIWKNSSNVSVLNTDIHSSRREGVSIEQDCPAAILFSACRIYHNGLVGFKITGKANVQLRKNSVFENVLCGIVMRGGVHATFVENAFFHNKFGGVYLGYNFASPVVLEKNHMHHNNGPGIIDEAAFNLQQSPQAQAMLERLVQPGILPAGESRLYSAKPTLRSNVIEANLEIASRPVTLPAAGADCSLCHQSLKDPKASAAAVACPRCKTVRYCTPACRSIHEARHEPLCVIYREKSILLDPVTMYEKGLHVANIPNPTLKVPNGIKPPKAGGPPFIVKIQTPAIEAPEDLTKPLRIYDATRRVELFAVDATIFWLILLQGMMGKGFQYTAKKAFFFAELSKEGKVRVDLSRFPEPQDW